MFDVLEIVQIHEDKVAKWHSESIANDQCDFLAIVCQQHIYNFELWHQEDIARSPEVSDAQLAKVKRSIDKLNQARNDHIEKMDDWISECLVRLQVNVAIDARQHTETAGSVIDRLSILALRIYHYQEQCQRKDVDAEHLRKVQSRLTVCNQQRQDLAAALERLVRDLETGRAIHKTYRQFKMYNDPSLNPFLYSAKSRTESTE